MSLKDEKAEDLAKILETIGETVMWNNRSFRALVSEPAIGEELNLGGFSRTGDFTIKILVADLSRFAAASWSAAVLCRFRTQ